jgi:phage host-nuclease inhibitor protein Gam
MLEELDEQMKTKLEKMTGEERKNCQVRLQRSVRAWLKESKFKRFIRDVIKIAKLAKIFERR